MIQSYLDKFYPLNEYHINSAVDGELILDSKTGHITIFNGKLNKYLSKTKELETRINSYNELKNDLTKQFLDNAEDIDYLVKEYDKFVKRKKASLQECEELKLLLDNLEVIIYSYLSKADAYYQRIHEFMYNTIQPYIDAIELNLKEILKLRANIEELEFLIKEMNDQKESNSSAISNLDNITYIGPPIDDKIPTIAIPDPPPTPEPVPVPTPDKIETRDDIKTIEIRLTSNQPMGLNLMLYPGYASQHIINIGKLNHPNWASNVNVTRESQSYGDLVVELLNTNTTNSIAKITNLNYVKNDPKGRYIVLDCRKLANAATGLVGDSGITDWKIFVDFYFNGIKKHSGTIMGDITEGLVIFYTDTNYNKEFKYCTSYYGMSNRKFKYIDWEGNVVTPSQEW